MVDIEAMLAATPAVERARARRQAEIVNPRGASNCANARGRVQHRHGPGGDAQDEALALYACSL